MRQRRTYAEIAADWSLWVRYVDPYMSREHFEALPFEERIVIQLVAFGPEQSATRGFVTDGSGRYLVKRPADDPTGFVLADEFEVWPGGLGSGMSNWRSVAPDDVPPNVRRRMEWLLEDPQAPPHGAPALCDVDCAG